MLSKQCSDLRNELSRVQTVQPAASPSAEAALSQQAFLSQMDDLENTYQKQLEACEAQLDSVKAENLTLCMELQEISRGMRFQAQVVR